MKKSLSFLAFGIILGVLGTALAIRQGLFDPPPSEFHEHAEFALFLNGERFDFSKDEFMTVEPCEIGETGWIPSARAHVGEEGLKSGVDLHNNVGHIIHLHREGITVRNFFNSLDMQFEDGWFVDRNGKETKDDAKNSFRAFRNGREVKDAPNLEMRDLDQLLVTYGPRNRNQTSIDAEMASLTNTACIYSNKCPHRGTAPAEDCGEANEP